MYRMERWLRGYARVELRGAQPAAFLNACAREGVEFREPVPIDAFTLQLTLYRRDLKRAKALCPRSQCELKLLRQSGAPVKLRRVRGRVALLAGLAACCVLLAWSFLHVWELEVVGNETASTAEILAALDKAGVSIGSFWPDFSNDYIKSVVLQEVPELSWIAVNVSGSRAVASVRERTPVPEVFDESVTVELVAEKAGLVTELQVLQGTAAVEVGQTVLPGELLISGEMVSSYEKAGARAVHARGQVYARTWYELTACAPLERMEKVYTGETELHLALEVGDRRINFYNVDDNSGNPDIKCDKLKRTHDLAIDGVFTTPLALITEQWRYYELQSVAVDAQALCAELEERLIQRLEEEVGPDGQVGEMHFSASERDGMLYVTLRSECVEDIAREQTFQFSPPAIPENTEGDQME